MSELEEWEKENLCWSEVQDLQRRIRARGPVSAQQQAPAPGVSCIRCFHCGKQVSTYHNNLVFRATATCPECTESGKDIDHEHDSAIAAQARKEGYAEGAAAEREGKD
jgi:hypothetical protein